VLVEGSTIPNTHVDRSIGKLISDAGGALENAGQAFHKAGLAMDVLGSTIAHRYTQEEVDGWLAQLEFQHVVRTIPTDEIYRKAYNDGCSAVPHFLEPAEPPYWFDAWREENYQNLLRRDMHDAEAPGSPENSGPSGDADQSESSSA